MGWSPIVWRVLSITWKIKDDVLIDHISDNHKRETHKKYWGSGCQERRWVIFTLLLLCHELISAWLPLLLPLWAVRLYFLCRFCLFLEPIFLLKLWFETSLRGDMPGISKLLSMKSHVRFPRKFTEKGHSCHLHFWYLARVVQITFLWIIWADFLKCVDNRIVRKTLKQI